MLMGYLERSARRNTTHAAIRQVVAFQSDSGIEPPRRYREAPTPLAAHHPLRVEALTGANGGPLAMERPGLKVMAAARPADLFVNPDDFSNPASSTMAR